jgi:chromosome segregation and condensation protein ScpB
MQCCCEDLKQVFSDRQVSLEQIGEHWKGKTQLLVGKYYKSLQVVREDQNKLKGSTIDAVD